jgi:glutathione S-transferase
MHGALLPVLLIPILRQKRAMAKGRGVHPNRHDGILNHVPRRGDGLDDWVGIEGARELPGLRLVLLRGLPSPWSLAAKAVFEFKGIDFQRVYRAPTDPPQALESWTGQASFPAAMHEDERPRTGWSEILLLAERLRPEPRLLPEDPHERALVFGLAHELCGEMGLGWCRRLIGLEPRLRDDPEDPGVVGFQQRYGSSPAERSSAKNRVVEVLGLLARILREQRAKGSEFLVGSGPSAADLYWATFSNMVSLLPPEKLPLQEGVRRGFSTTDPELLEALAPELIVHRDMIHERYLRLPVEV